MILNGNSLSSGLFPLTAGKWIVPETDAFLEAWVFVLLTLIGDATGSLPGRNKDLYIDSRLTIAI